MNEIIMNDIRKLRLPAEIYACVNASIMAGELIFDMSNLKSEIKSDDYLESHHVVVTPADRLSQSKILKTLHKKFPKVRFIVEEKCNNKELAKKVVNEKNFKKFLKNAFLIDGLDGTSQKVRDSYMWSVSVGHMKNGQLQGGSIFSPDVLGGLHVFGTKNRAYCIDHATIGHMNLHYFPDINVAKVSQTEDLKQSRIYIGADLLQNKKFTKFLINLANETRTHSVANSCAVALSEIACGKADAIVQAVQSPWDFAAGIPLVQGAGGVVQFYHLYEKRMYLTDKLEAEDFNPSKRSAGFIAGNNKKIVTELTDRLVDEYAVKRQGIIIYSQKTGQVNYIN